MKTLVTYPIKQPRRIDPSLIEIGDDISVEFKKSRGLTTSNRGIVGKIVKSGAARFLCTSEGATIMSWTPGHKANVKVTLYGRAVKVQDTLFDAMDELRERIAS